MSTKNHRGENRSFNRTKTIPELPIAEQPCTKCELSARFVESRANVNPPIFWFARFGFAHSVCTIAPNADPRVTNDSKTVFGSSVLECQRTENVSTNNEYTGPISRNALASGSVFRMEQSRVDSHSAFFTPNLLPLNQPIQRKQRAPALKHSDARALRQKGTRSNS